MTSSISGTGADLRRILVIDDNPAIHDDFRKVLCPPALPSDQLRDAAASLFGRVPTAGSRIRYEVDAVARGQDGLAKVRAAMAEGRPYVMAFVDMRMPNGWNGIETTQQIWALAPGLQIVLCTAFSDVSWEEIRAELPQTDRFLILKKPFDNVEVLQIAEAIVARHRAEKQLLENERILREAQEVARIGHFAADPATRAWTQFETLHPIFGVGAGFSPTYENWLALIDPGHREALALAIDRAIATGGGFELTCRVNGADGQARWVAARGRCERNARGEPSRLIGTFQEITREYESREQLRLLEACVAQLNDSILITEAQPLSGKGPRIVFVNDTFIRQTGYTRAEVLGQTPRMLQGPLTQRNLLDRIAQALTLAEPVRVELINYRRNRQAIWINLDITPVKDANGVCTHFVGIQREIAAPQGN